MYQINFYDRRTRHLLAGGMQSEGLPDPASPVAPAAIRDGELAEAIEVNDPRHRAHHFNGQRWAEGLLPGRVNQMHR